MLSSLPTDISKIPKDHLDKEVCRVGMIAELDAVSFYEQLADVTEDDTLRKVLLDIAREEKTHLAEFETVLKRLDPEQVAENAKGEKEVQTL